MSNASLPLRHLAFLSLAAALLTVALVEPAAAQFAGVERTLQSIVDVLTGSIARLIAIIAVALCGLGWMFGFLDLRRTGTLIVGIAVVFAASEIVGTLSGGGP
jgi:type IV secretory pathway VirB2 component (pilin)